MRPLAQITVRAGVRVGFLEVATDPRSEPRHQRVEVPGIVCAAVGANTVVAQHNMHTVRH